jgi:ABC-2 type transport system ATP-binding protein
VGEDRPVTTSVAGPAIRAEGLVKRYGGRAVVDGLDLTVTRGAITALLGPNGAGKTTTVEIIEGYRRADVGSVTVLGLDPWGQGRALRERLGLMLQEGGVQPLARPRELLRLYARFWADPLDPDELLGELGLEAVAATPWRRLSGGERQRLSLGLALVGRPELLILDEPTAGMDPAAKVAARERLRALREAGTTILLTSHELPDVERLADRIVIIDHGRLVASGTPAELLAGAGPRLRLRLERPLTADERGSLEAAIAPVGASRVGVLDEPRSLVVEDVEPSPALTAAVATWLAEQDVHALELRTIGPSLEERYLELVGPDAGNGDGTGTDAGEPGTADPAGPERAP